MCVGVICILIDFAVSEYYISKIAQELLRQTQLRPNEERVAFVTYTISYFKELDTAFSEKVIDEYISLLNIKGYDTKSML